jgi:hypothetical protein
MDVEFERNPSQPAGVERKAKGPDSTASDAEPQEAFTKSR